MYNSLINRTIFKNAYIVKILVRKHKRLGGKNSAIQQTKEPRRTN